MNTVQLLGRWFQSTIDKLRPSQVQSQATSTIIEELFADFNGGLVHLKTEHAELAANVLRVDGTPGPDVHCLNEAGADFALLTLEGRAYFEVLGQSVMLYSQRDPRWRNLIYAGGLTFAAAGCYVTAVAMILSLAGYGDEPPIVAAKLREAGCFSGALLTRPDGIPAAYPTMRYDGAVLWHKVAADLEKFKAELSKGPVIIEVDFVPPTAKFNQHFVVAERLTSDGNDLVIADPWDGTRTKLLERYAKDSWDLGRALYGMRLLRVKT